MKPFLTVYGHVAIDQIIDVKDFPLEDTSVDVLKKSTHLGGTGTNIAVHAARLGVPTAISAFIGKDFPDGFKKVIGDSGVDIGELRIVDGFDTSQAMIVNNSGFHQKVLFYQGPQGVASRIGIRCVDKASSSDYIHICTGDPLYYLDIINDIKGKIAIDPAQEIHRIWNSEYLKKAMERTDSLFCNRYEFESVKKYLGVESEKEIDVPLFVCTMGEDGSKAMIDGELFSIPAVKPEKIADTTGAGDSFRGGFYAGLYHGLDVHESLIVGAATSSFIIEEPGALTAEPTWDLVMERADPYLKKI